MNNYSSNTYFFAVTWFILNLLTSVFNDVIAKFIGNDLPIMEVTFFRFLFGAISLLPLIIYYGPKVLRTSRISVHFMRGVILFFAINLWIFGLSIVPIAAVTTIGFSIPMFILILAPIFLKEKVDISLWGATLVGFIGVYVTLNPHQNDFNPYCLLLLVGALMFATLDIINKKFVVQETMIGMLFYSALFTTLLSLPFVYNVWVMPSLNQICMLVVLGVGGNLILFFVLKAFALVNASSLSPYRYLELIFSAAIGYILFDEQPSWHIYLGCAIILPASFYIAYENSNGANKKLKQDSKVNAYKQNEATAE